MNKRHIFTIILFISILTGPWWIYLPFLGIMTLIFPFYIEGIILSFIIEAAYKPFPEGFSIFNFPLALIVTLLVIILIPLREHIRIHA